MSVDAQADSTPAGGPQRRYFDALAAGRFELPACRACGTLHFPPSPICPACGGTAFDWRAGTGRGTVHASTTVRRRAEAGGDYGVCLVDLDEGVRLMSCVDGLAPHDVSIGLRVVASVRPGTGGAMRLVFEPARGG